MKILLEITLIIALNLFLYSYVHRRLLVALATSRQQLANYVRQGKKPVIRERDRLFWVLLSKISSEWREMLVIVKPATVISWERRRFRRFWKKLSTRKNKVGRPTIPQEHIDFIRDISRQHPEYSATRIAGILKANFGIKHSKNTVEKYRVKSGKPPRDSQTWRTFLKNHADSIWCCDFLVQYTFFFIPIYVFIILELGCRKIVHFGVTRNPTLDWVKQQIREATPWGESPRFLIHDNDGIFGQHPRSIINEKTGRKNTFRSSLDFWLHAVMGIKGIPIPYEAPNANAHCERAVLTIRSECLNHFVIFGARQLRRILKEYIAWYNHGRYHQGIKGIPDAYTELREEKPRTGKLVALPVLNGLHHDYRLAA